MPQPTKLHLAGSGISRRARRPQQSKPHGSPNLLREREVAGNPVVPRRVVTLALVLAIAWLAGCDDDRGDDASWSCSAIRLDESSSGIVPSASTRDEDIVSAIEATKLAVSGETPPSAVDWDLAAIGPLGAAPGDCDVARASEPGVLDVTFRGDEGDDALWVVLVSTDIDLGSIDRVALNGELIDLAR